MDGIVIISALAAIAILAASGKKVAGMEQEVSADNVRRGVQNGWYTATLIEKSGRRAVRLSGKTKDGKAYSDIYAISDSDYMDLLNEGYPVEL